MHGQRNISLNYILVFYYRFGYFTSSLGQSDLRNDSVKTQLRNLRLMCLNQNLKILTFLREIK